MTKRRAVLIVSLLAAGAAADETVKETRSKGEITADAEKQFARADANADGKIAGEELVKGWSERYDLDGDAKVTRAEFVEVALRPPKLRHATPMRDAYWRAKFDVMIFDKNKDGTIQREEYPGDEGKFRKYDRNKDGAFSPAELLAMATDEIEDIRKQMRNPDRYEFLTLFDADKDGNVGLDEYDGPSDAFKKYDKNDDGLVAYDELYPERMRMKFDEEPKYEPESLNMIETMDKDKDGKVSRAEFKGTDDAWKRLDRNGDGVVTMSDAR
jgi:Ca2+-binding EF-hand superfamily protein